MSLRHSISSFHMHMPQHSASACLQLPLFILFTLRDVTWLVSEQQKVPEILATFSPSVQVGGI